MGEAVFFWIFATASVLSALAVVFPPLPSARTPTHSAVALLACVLFLAAIYMLLGAHALAVLQVIVSAGAVMVLLLFVIMLVKTAPGQHRAVPVGLFKVVSLLLGVSATAALIMTITAADFIAPISAELRERLSDPEGFGTIKAVGRLLYNRYLLPFELTSILLLIAMIGVVIIAKRDPRTAPADATNRACAARDRSAPDSATPSAGMDANGDGAPGATT